MSKIWDKLKMWVLALVASLLLWSPSAHAQAINAPYVVGTGAVITDNAGNTFEPFIFGCGFDQNNGDFLSAQSDPGASVPLQNWCDRDNDGTREPANFYWKVDDSSLWITASGERAAEDGRAANAIPPGSHPAFLFPYTAGVAPSSLQSITLENGNDVGTASPIETIDFDGNCRQQAGELSWIVCPVINFANEIIVGTIRYVLEFLRPEPLLLGTTRGDYLHEAWKQFLSIANLLLIPVFLISIYVMVTSANSAYTVSKILPRLVISVLLMQVSFYIAAIIIDIGNILATGIAGIFNSVNASLDSTAASQAIGHLAPELGGTALDRGVGAAVGGGLAISAGILAFTVGALPPLMILITTFLIGILLTFIALALRQLAIVVFVVLSPLAMLLGVLPTTEKWMKEWFDNIIKLVLVYPVIVLFFSAASTLSRISLASGNTGEVNQIVAASLPIVVLISIPILFRIAGRLFKSVSGYLSGVTTRAKGGILGDPKDPYSAHAGARAKQAHKVSMRSNRLAGIAGLGWTGALTRPLIKNKLRLDQAAAPLKELYDTKKPDALKRLFFGEVPFKSRLGIENYEQKDLDGTNSWRYDIARYRRDPTALALLAGNELAEASSFHPERALNALFGIGSQYGSSLAPDQAKIAFESFQGAVRTKQIYSSGYSLDDVRNSWVQAPGPDGHRNAGRLFDYGYGDYHALPGQHQGRNLEIKERFVGMASGMLGDSSSAFDYNAAAGALSDDRIMSRYAAVARVADPSTLSTADQKFRREMDALLMKGAGMGRNLYSQISPADLARIAAGATTNERDAMAAGGGYNRTGSDMVAMRDFINAVENIRRNAGLPSIF